MNLPETHTPAVRGSFRPDLFLGAQAEPFGRHVNPIAEIYSGKKRTCWMWFVFPQLALGSSPVSRLFALEPADALPYLTHPILGDRLTRACEAVLATPVPPRRIFGSLDEMKLKASMTLFWTMTGGRVFDDVLRERFNGESHVPTLAIIAR